MPYLIDTLTLLHRQLKEFEQTHKDDIEAFQIENEIQAIDEAFKTAFEAYENADDPDELPGDTPDQHQATELWFKRRI